MKKLLITKRLTALLWTLVLTLMPMSLMADNNTPLSVTVKNHSGGFEGEFADKAFDGITTNKWCGKIPTTTGINPFVEVQLTATSKLDYYYLYTGNDINYKDEKGVQQHRNPKEWNLYAKVNEGDDWTLISHVTDAGLPTTVSTRSENYKIDAAYQNIEYNYLKFEILQIEQGNIFEVGEICFVNCAHEYAEGSAICSICGKIREHDHSYTNGVCVYLGCTSPYQQPEGEGTLASPYLIGNAGNLAWYRDQTINNGKRYSIVKLTADIDMAAVCSETIGSWKSIDNFKGTFDGDGHVLNNLYIEDNVIFSGLFNENYGTIKSLGIESGSMTTHNIYAGAICGTNRGKIINCFNKMNVTSTYNRNNYADVGGICGWNAGAIERCYNSGNISCPGAGTGGICGESNGGTIRFCYNTGTVSGRLYVGGLCGETWNEVNVNNCYNTGDVSGAQVVGGICGRSFNAAQTISCYNTGKVKANEGEEAGAINGSYELVAPNNYYLDKGTADAQGKAMTEEQFASGEVAWLLNGSVDGEGNWTAGKTDGTQAWYQALGTDSHPVLVKTGDNTVYADDNLKCDGTPDGTKLYGNSPVQGNRDAHSYDKEHLAEDPDEGTTCLYSYLCDNCHTPATDRKAIRTAGEPYWFVVLEKQDGKWIAPDEDDLRLIDDCALNIPIDFTPVAVRLMRSFDADGWYSLCLPFDVTDISMFAQVAEFSNIEGDTYKFRTVSAIEAGKAYIVRVDSDIDYPMFYGVTLKTGEPATNGDFIGVYSPTELVAGCKVIGTGSTVNPVNPGTMKGFRAYFPASAAGAKAMRFTVDDGEATSIELMQNAEPKEGGQRESQCRMQNYYNLSGQKVNENYRGIVVKNGKKVLKK